MLSDFTDHDTPPKINIHSLPVFLDGKRLSEYTLLVGRYWCEGSLQLVNETSYTMVNHIAHMVGYLLPVEYAGFPVVHETHVEFRKYSPIDLEPRRAMLASISAGFARLREKKFATIIGRPFPEELVRLVKEFL